MGVLTSLFAGVSGMNAAGQQISIIGDNIANVNTPGFKASRAEFQDVLAGNLAGSGSAGQIGAGARIAGVSQSFTQGSLESTDVTTDLAIDGGGFFVLQDTTGISYTRAGLFRLDATQQLVNAQGQSVLGFGISPGGVPNGGLGAIVLSNAASVPSATTSIDVNVNIDPNDTAIPAANPFDHLDPISHSNFQTGIRTFDSLGNPRNVTIHFRKDDLVANRWVWYAGVNRSDLDMAAYGGAFAQGPAAAQTQFIPVQSGTLDFDSTGVLSLETNAALLVQFDHDGDGALDGAPEATPQLWRWADGANSATIGPRLRELAHGRRNRSRSDDAIRWLHGCGREQLRPLHGPGRLLGWLAAERCDRRVGLRDRLLLERTGDAPRPGGAGDLPERERALSPGPQQLHGDLHLGQRDRRLTESSGLRRDSVRFPGAVEQRSRGPVRQADHRSAGLPGEHPNHLDLERPALEPGRSGTVIAEDMRHGRRRSDA